jgi:hypothetical protein
MATGPQIPPTVIFANELTWLQKHERLIIVILVLALGGWLGNKWMNVSAENAKSALAIQQQVSAAAASQAALAAQTYQAAIDALSKANVALAASQQARNAALAKQQTVTATLPPDQVVTMWQGLIPGINKGSITPTGDGGYKVDGGPAIDTVNTLEEVPVLRANLSDETKLAETTQTALNSCSTLVENQKTEIAEDKKTCDAQTKSLKADARKSKRNWFIGGLVTAATIVGFIAIHGI